MQTVLIDVLSRAKHSFQRPARPYSSKPVVEKQTKTPVPKISARKIALPTEHGGWAFLLEPLVGGLAIAFSAAGVWIAVMIVGAFLTRQPLKVLVIDRLGMKVAERARTAVFFVIAFGAVASLGLFATLLTSGTYPLTPLGLVLPLAVVQLYFDFSRQSRHLLPEIGGSVAISAGAAAIALAGGLEWAAALGLWVIFISRSLTSILYVRQRLLLEKGKKFSRTAPIAAHILSLVLITALAYFGLAPILTLLPMTLLLFRAAEGLSEGRIRMKATKIGILEVIYGTVTVFSVVIGYHAGF
jgi:hypothetical protein